VGVVANGGKLCHDLATLDAMRAHPEFLTNNLLANQILRREGALGVRAGRMVQT
jgi:hypothetical protein